MRSVTLTVGNQLVGEYPTWAYPAGKSLGYFAIPTYSLAVAGTAADKSKVSATFEIIRFGVQSTDGKKARVVGLAADQTHAIKSWLPHYVVHSAASTENGAWKVYDNFLIHDGPDTKDEVFASIGCIEVVGPKGFTRFNDLMIELSGPSSTGRSDQLREIGKTRNISITYLGAARPSLKKWK